MLESRNDPAQTSGSESDTYEVLPALVPSPVPSDSIKSSFFSLGLIPLVVNSLAILAHGILIYLSLGAFEGLTSHNPIPRDDHPLYYHSAIVTQTFLKTNGSTAGYDPTFMAGYPKSAVFPASSTLPELVIAISSGWVHPAVAYKFYVLISAILAPVLLTWAASGLTQSRSWGLLSCLFFLIYIWTDFPIQYVGFGMLPYFLSIPMGLATLRVCCNWLSQGKFQQWAGMTALLALTVMVHFTALMVLGPAALAAWGWSNRTKKTALLGLISLLIAALMNAFWWYPGLLLASTKGESGFAFAHPEGMINRLVKIFWNEAPVESLLITGLLAGCPLLFSIRKIPTAGLLGFAISGFFWGYAAGAFRSLDFLQPGRHTFAFYSASSIFTAVLAGITYETFRRINFKGAVAFGFGCILLLTRLFGPILVASGGSWVDPASSPLNSRPAGLFMTLRQTLSQNVPAGSRILYEEGGFGPDPYAGGRFSGILADQLGIEMIGGPYLHAALSTNTAQFGEGKLFGKENWDLAWLEQVSQRYGITWMVAWSERSQRMIDSHPEKFRTVLRDGPFRICQIIQNETLSPKMALLGNEHLNGPVKVSPEGIGIEIRPASGGIEVDRIVVLRYHWAPGLQIQGQKDVDVQPEDLPGTSLPALIRLRLGPSVEGPLEIHLNPWGD